jgi:alanine dehydrogenase
MLFLKEDEVRRLLPMRDCVQVMRETFEALGAGEASYQPRRRLALPNGTLLHQLSGAWGGYIGAKIYASNVKKGAHFLVLLFDAESTVPLAVIEGNHLGQIRTGAATGYATDLMARADAKTLAVIGTGFQAWTQLEAILTVRAVSAVRVYSRSEEKRRNFALRASEEFGVRVEAAPTGADCVRGADIVVTATYSKEPVIEDAWVGPGTHVNAVGSNNAARREVPGELVRRASVVAVDSIEQAKIEAGDLILAVPIGEWSTLPLVELSAIAQDCNWQRKPQGVTLFKSLGLGVEDVAAAAWVYQRAVETGAGRAV